MNNFKFELDSKGVRELLKSQEMMDVCDAYAKGVANRCGFGFKTNKFVGKNRVNVSVFPKTKFAVWLNYKYNVLLKAIK